MSPRTQLVIRSQLRDVVRGRGLSAVMGTSCKKVVKLNYFFQLKFFLVKL